MATNPLDDRKAKQKADAQAMLAPKAPSQPAPQAPAPPQDMGAAQDPQTEGMDQQGMEDARFASIEDRLAAVEAHCGISQPGQDQGSTDPSQQPAETAPPAQGSY